MKLTFVLALCALALTLGLALEMKAVKPEAEAASVPAALTQEPQKPATAPTPVEEWNPRRQGIGDQTERSFEEAAGPKQMIPYVKLNKAFTPEEFAKYLRQNVTGHSTWKPEFIVLHNTGVPSIAQRPQGFTKQNMEALARYYGEDQRWHSGPHLFVDQNGIWVFSYMTKPGTHSPSWNPISWGVEQLGDFTREDYNSGDGAKIRANTISALAIMAVVSGTNIDTLHFHFEDPRTTHKSCPGSTCHKDAVIAAVKGELDKWKAFLNSH